MTGQVLNFMGDSPFLTFFLLYLVCWCAVECCKAIFGGKCKKCKNYENKNKES